MDGRCEDQMNVAAFLGSGWFRRARLSAVALVGLLGPVFLGCTATVGGEPPTSTGMDGSVLMACDAPATVFKARCGAAICHSPGATTPDLVSAGVWSRLVGQPEKLSPQCVGMSLVAPTKPADGVLLKRMAGTTCSVLMMPSGTTSPDQAAIACITEWVNAQLAAR